MMAAAGGGDRLTDLPEEILLHILSMLPNSRQVVQMSVLSSQWRFLWKSVQASLYYNSEVYRKPYKKEYILDYAASVNRELHHWRFCDKIKSFRVFPNSYEDFIAHDVDLWVHFAFIIGKVEEFTLKFCYFKSLGFAYNFPEYAYTNTVLRNLVLGYCWLRPSGNVKWSNLVSLSIGDAVMTEGVMEKVLSGCPNLECLELDKVVGIRCLDITSAKLTKLIVTIYETDYDEDHCLEIHAPYIRHLELLGLCYDKIHFQLRNVASLVTALLSVEVYFADLEENLEKECKYLQELLHHVANVKNLELGPWCIECLSILEFKGWPVPPSSWKFLKLNAALEPYDYPGICSFLSSSSCLETLVIDWCHPKPRKLLSMYTNEDERRRRFETHSFNWSMPHLKMFKFINFCGKSSENKFVDLLIKCLRENAIALKKYGIALKFKGRDVFWNYVVRSS
ncbi:F-box protein At5g03100-like isoform X3 [Solanum pennellii]|uniref:F-box protein At5g03100-like isoform X3 n=1 Tax=Solanum pennellii TaxID=28526 RepID=A0ABM1VG30_SOLPN|nr:F-box protein At5g03100-like isoform X3 [Solanum pennellii]